MHIESPADGRYYITDLKQKKYFNLTDKKGKVRLVSTLFYFIFYIFSSLGASLKSKRKSVCQVVNLLNTSVLMCPYPWGLEYSVKYTQHIFFTLKLKFL